VVARPSGGRPSLWWSPVPLVVARPSGGRPSTYTCSPVHHYNVVAHPHDSITTYRYPQHLPMICKIGANLFCSSFIVIVIVLRNASSLSRKVRLLMNMQPDIPSHLEREFGEYPTRALKYALHYAGQEWPVVPLYTINKAGVCTCHQGATCNSRAKHPIPTNGVKAATTKSAVIEQWWKTHPQANIGIATGFGLHIIDIDPRHGGSLEQLARRFALPETAMVRTGSGGWHLYFFYAGDLKNSAGKLGEGIDTRGMNGYVVAPPSLHATGNYYAWVNQLPPAPLPQNIVAALSQPLQPKLHQGVSLPSPVPTPAKPILPVPQRNATQLIALAKAAAIPEGKRNTALLSMAGALRNQGATLEAIVEALKIINIVQCKPPLTEAEVRKIAESASRWEQGQPAQSQNVLPEMFPLDVLLNTPLPEPKWAIPLFLPAGVSLLAGKPKMGKSWLALAISLAIAEGRLALGKLPVTQGDVLYLGLEDSMRRMADRASKLLQGRTPPANFTWVGMWNQLGTGGLADIEDWLYKHKEARLVVIDTLAKVRPPSTNMGTGYGEDYAIMTPLKKIAEDNNVAILVIHHLRKMGAPDVMDTISGTTGLTGATDCNMVLDRERGKSEATLHITGRDIEEQELTLSFTSETAQWTLQEGLGSRRMSKERRDILGVLEKAKGPMSPMEISEKIGSDREPVRKLLRDMVKDNEICQVRRGVYELSQSDALEGPELVQGNILTDIL